jgi:hypothetical protein
MPKRKRKGFEPGRSPGCGLATDIPANIPKPGQQSRYMCGSLDDIEGGEGILDPDYENEKSETVRSTSKTSESENPIVPLDKIFHP